ncbi:hypothetical protein NKR23_g5096 [Pleurostoma richardsiae]|uniref:Uncharacterized protein n=1 Tax=Pleurostoma richardsiae TaxID=41990 RepID=A0AA38RTN1_9PEZI|nr:hypothetical protein NKR23_g5096 [Pleurostoma richardsiae]
MAREDWTAAYVLVCLVPAAFVTSALVSVVLERRARRQQEGELPTVEQLYARHWFPWRDAVRAAEPEEGLAEEMTEVDMGGRGASSIGRV